MRIYPTMQLLNGRCVSLDLGRIEEAEIWHVDPMATARSWAAAGAEWMHLTDLDWVDGRAGNADQTQAIIRAAGIPVQLAGGFRSAEAVARWIDLGAARIVISTLAAQDPKSVMALARRFPDQIVLSLDIWRGRVMINGWRDESAFTPEAFLAAFAEAPLAAIVITDIEGGRDQGDAQIGVVAGLAARTRAPVIAAGVVHTLDDVARLKYVPNISGALVGRPLFARTINLADALATARPEPEQVAEFL
jgi:phosphoribosylformimino-5-aminoimidazole carboxamide ribotide isomerase